ncbi:MAG TPA: DUF6019 family protein [Hanamia sp.]|nr:DUF6019 family protein [Hanamia sp.]
MKKILLLVPIIILGITAIACPMCEAQTPKVLRGLAQHGSGPRSNWDYLAGGITALIVLITLFYSIKWVIKPGEKEENHIKRTILNF